MNPRALQLTDLQVRAAASVLSTRVKVPEGPIQRMMRAERYFRTRQTYFDKWMGVTIVVSGLPGNMYLIWSGRPSLLKRIIIPLFTPRF